MPEVHARFSASGSDRWMSCPGSLQLEDGQPNESSTFANEGTAAHTLASWCLETGMNGGDYPEQYIVAEGETFTIDEDMIENVQVYVDYCRNLISLAATHGIERRVDYSENIGQPDAFGTADFVALVGTELNVVDLKYGMGIRVDAENNSQLQMYALGALNEYELMYDVETVRVTICQPRKQHIDEWVTTPAALKQFAEHAKARAYMACQSNAAEIFLVPGPKQCKFCKAKAVCPAIKNAVYETITGRATDASADDFTDLTLADVAMQAALFGADGVDVHPNEIVAAILPKLDMIEDWCAAIRNHARTEIKAGRDVPGFKLVAGRKGNRAWSDAAAVEAAFKSMRLKQDEMYDLKLIGVPAAEKLLKETPKRWNRIAPLIGQSDGAPSLVPASDPKPALVFTPATDDFDDLTAVEELEGADLV